MTILIGTTSVMTRLIKMRVVKNQTANGKIAKFSALVVAGNGKGGLGFAHAKCDSLSDAYQKAAKKAIKNIEYYERFKNRTIFHDDFVKFKSTKLFVRPAPPNFGKRCHPAIAEICKCMGILDISAEVKGSTHPMNVLHAFMKILKRQRSPDEIALETGYRFEDIKQIFNQNLKYKGQILL